MKALDRVRGICLALPGTYEKIAWSAPTKARPKPGRKRRRLTGSRRPA